MLKATLEHFNEELDKPDISKLILRLCIAMMLFHGVHKLMAGLTFIEGALTAHGLPGFIAYGVIVGEVIAPIFILIGFLTRISAAVVAFTMVVAYLLADTSATFQVDQVGAWAIESLMFYFLVSLGLIFMGGGRYSLIKNPVWR